MEVVADSFSIIDWDQDRVSSEVLWRCVSEMDKVSEKTRRWLKRRLGAIESIARRVLAIPKTISRYCSLSEFKFLRG